MRIGQELFAFASLVFTLLIYLPYIASVFKRRVHPHIFSWLLWGFGSFAVFVAQLLKGGGLGAYPTAIGGFLCLLVVILSIRFADKNITRSDWLLFVGALLAIPLWALTKHPLTAVIIITVIDAVAAIPTMRKSYHNPFQESVPLFLFSGLRFVFSIPALESFNLTTVLFPAVIGLTNFLVVLLILWRRRVLSGNFKLRELIS